MDASDLRVKEFSIYLRDIKTRRHTFSNVNPRFLALASVIPGSWEWEEKRFVSSHNFNAITYENKSLLMGGDDYLIASQKSGIELGKRPELSNHIIKYIESFAPETFDKAEMTWKFYAELKNASTWIMNRFFQPNLIPRVWKEPQAIPAFNFQSKGATIFYRFSVDEENKLLAIDCQAHTPSPTDDEGLTKWLSNYHDHETAMFTNLVQLIEI